ncbi:MAG: pentapeptide repeat-containing protein [Hyphomicrobium sp.]
MRIDQEQFDKTTGPPETWGETYFSYCAFNALSIEGGSFDGAYIGCAFTGFDLYWGLFNCAVLANTTFEDCRFRGTSFRTCQFVGCHFINCRFELDNLLAECTFDGCTLAECAFKYCVINHNSPSGRPVFSTTRFYGCTQKGCQGLEGRL